METPLRYESEVWLAVTQRVASTTPSCVQQPEMVGGYRFVARVTAVTDIVAASQVGSDVPRLPEERPGAEPDRAPLQPPEAPFPPPAGGRPALRGLGRDVRQVHAALASTYVGLGQRADAARHAERAVALLPVTKDAVEAPLYLYLLAQVYAQTGDPGRGVLPGPG